MTEKSSNASDLAHLRALSAENFDMAMRAGRNWERARCALIIRLMRDALHDATEWMDGCGAKYAWPESIETGRALAQAEDWLAEQRTECDR